MLCKICPQLEHLYIIKYLPVQKAFFPEISLDTYLPQLYVEDVITLHTQLELLCLAGQQTHDHINSTQFFKRAWNMFALFLLKFI